VRAVAVRLGARVAGLWSKPASRLVAIAVVMCAATAGFLTVLLASPPRAEPTLLTKPITIKRALSTTVASFGDRIEAEVDVYTDGRTIDAGSVRVRPDFTPYRAVSTRVDRARRGVVSLLRSRIVLSCVTKACVPPRGGGSLRFRPLTVTYRARGQHLSVQVPWGSIQLSSRLPLDPTAHVGVVDTAPALNARFSLSPALLRGLLILVAAILGLAGAASVVSGLWPPFFSLLRSARPVSPLESSLLQVETAARSGDETARRHVLDQLATHLAELPSPVLEARTRSLAWAASTPEPEALTRLAQQVRSSLNGGLLR
jgi:hypothetical protein